MALVPEVRKIPRVLGFAAHRPQVPPDLFSANSEFTTSTICFEACPPMINIPLLSLTCPHPWKTIVIGCCCLDIGKYLRPALQKQLG